MNHRKVTELRQRATRKLSEARQIYDVAQRKKRELTYDEQRRWDAAMEEHDSLHAEADAGEAELNRQSERETEEWFERYRTGKQADAHVVRSGEQLMDRAVRRGWKTELDEEIHRELSLGAYFRAVLTGKPRTDLERRALQEGSNSAGGFVTPEPLAIAWLDLARARQVLNRAGMVTIGLESDNNAMARVTGDPTWSFYGELQSSTDSDPSFDRVTFTPYTLRGIIRASRELQQDAPNFDSQLESVMTASMARAIDAAGLTGQGSTGGEPLGLLNSTGVTRISLSTSALGSQTDYRHFVRALQALEDANYGPQHSQVSAIMAPRTYYELQNLQESSSVRQPLRMPGVLEDVQMLRTTAVPTNLVDLSTAGGGTEVAVGNFSQLAYGARLDPSIMVLQERYAGEYAIGFLAAARLDFQRLRDAAFVRIQGIGESTL